jgi:hypothetical protein
VKLIDNCCTATISSRLSQLLRDSSFEAIAKMLSESAPKFNPDAVQEALWPGQDSIKAWAVLAQNQAKEMQSALAATVEFIKGGVANLKQLGNFL